MVKYVLSNNRRKGLSGPAAVLTSLFLVLLIVCPAAASSAVDWDVAPSNPYVGDTLVITGTATDANAELAADVSFEKTVSVSGGEYEYEIDEVEVPSGDNTRFTVKAQGVTDLNVKVKKYVWLPSLSTDAASGVAVISQSHVPAMTYGVKIYGTALEGESGVDLKVTASQTINSDSEGTFRYEYGTGTMPAGDYEINIGGVSKTITLRIRKASGGHSDTPPATIKPARKEEKIPEEPLGSTSREAEVGPGEAPEIGSNSGETEAGTGTGTGTGTETKTPAEKESVLDGNFMVFGIIASLLAITLIWKLRK